MKSLILMWAATLVILLIIEGATAQLVTIWFAAGALAALIAAALNAPLWLQITLFVVVSAVTLIATRPLVKRITNRKAENLNADRIIGRQAIVTERIDNLEGTGSVKVDGLVWTARSEDDDVLEQGSKVTIVKIEGVKVIVSQNH